MGESAMKFKLKRESCSMRNLWESNAFGYFGYMGAGLDHGSGHLASTSPQKNERLTPSKG